MEYKIGEEIELIRDNKTIKLKIEESSVNSCENCFFSNKNRCLRPDYGFDTIFCSSIYRSDKKNIIFKEIKQNSNIMRNFKMITSESCTFGSIDDMFEECKNASGIIPGAAIKIEDKPYMPMSNVFDAIRSAEHIKNVAHKHVTLAIYTPEFTEAGTICLVTTVYE